MLADGSAALTASNIHGPFKKVDLKALSGSYIGQRQRYNILERRRGRNSSGEVKVGRPVWETINAQVLCPLRLSGLIITRLNVYINTAYQPRHQSSQ